MVAKTYLIPALLSGALLASAVQAGAPDPRFDMQRERSMNSEQMQSAPIYGQEIMTSWEIERHREMLRSMRTPEHTKAFVNEHRQRMDERADGMGVELAEEDASLYRGWRSQSGDMQTLQRHSETNHSGP